MSEVPAWFDFAWRNTALRVEGAYLHERNGPWHKRHPAREPWMYAAVLTGRLRVRQGAWSDELGPGGQVILMTDRPFEMAADKGNFTLVSVDFRVQSTLLASDPLPMLGLPAVVYAEPSAAWIESCRRAVEACGPARPARYRSLVGRGQADALITSYLVCGIESGAISCSLGTPVPDWLVPIRASMVDDWRRRDRVAEIASKAGYSRAHFHREYRRVFGETPAATLWRMRLDIAARRLEEDLVVTVADVAAACSFKSQSHFTQKFRRRFGITPTAWRRRHRVAP